MECPLYLTYPWSQRKKRPLSDVFYHAIDTLYKLSTVHPDGNSMQKWVQHQNMDSMEQFIQ